MALRANDTPTARLISDNLGQVEQVEANEGMSYGVNDMRDGVNLSRMQVTRPLVMHTEVTNLPNLSGFLRFGRNLPVLRFKDKYNRLQDAAPAFLRRRSSPVRIELEPIITGAGEAKSTPDIASSSAGANGTTSHSSHRTKNDPELCPELPLGNGGGLDGNTPPTRDEPLGRIDHGSNLPETKPTVEALGRYGGPSLWQHSRTDGPSKPANPA